MSRLEDDLGLVYDGEGRTVGRITKVGGIRVPPPRPTMPTLLVAGSFEQGAHWARAMGLVLKDTAGVYRPAVRVFSPGRERALDGILPREVYFVGEWRALDVEALARLWGFVLSRKVHVTHVCDAYGRVSEAFAEWLRWTPPSRGEGLTKWHLLEPMDTFDAYRTLCGIEMTKLALTTARELHAEKRWGPPRDACGVCAHAHSKWPPTSPDAWVRTLNTIRRGFQGMTAVTGEAKIGMEHFRAAWEG